MRFERRAGLARRHGPILGADRADFSARSGARIGAALGHSRWSGRSELWGRWLAKTFMSIRSPIAWHHHNQQVMVRVGAPVTITPPVGRPNPDRPAPMAAGQRLVLRSTLSSSGERAVSPVATRSLGPGRAGMAAAATVAGSAGPAPTSVRPMILATTTMVQPTGGAAVAEAGLADANPARPNTDYQPVPSTLLRQPDPSRGRAPRAAQHEAATPATQSAGPPTPGWAATDHEAPAIDVDDLTKRVVDAIDRRLIAHRERMGRC